MTSSSRLLVVCRVCVSSAEWVEIAVEPVAALAIVSVIVTLFEIEIEIETVSASETVIVIVFVSVVTASAVLSFETDLFVDSTVASAAKAKEYPAGVARMASFLCCVVCFLWNWSG